MTRKELIDKLIREGDPQDEIQVSVEDQVHNTPGSMPLLLDIDYVAENFINITIV